MDKDDIGTRVLLHDLKILSDNHYVLRRASFDWRRGDGQWQHQLRESYDQGNGVAVLPFDKARDMVLLIRQFRWPTFEAGYRKLLIEAIAGKLDGDEPAFGAEREAMEEAGVRLSHLALIFHCFTSPGAVTERLYLFVADYDSTAPRAAGGGHVEEGEDIEVLEMSLDDAMAMISRGDIIDAKTIMLLQHLKLRQGTGG